MLKEDLAMLNAIIDKLTKNRFFEMYMRKLYGYLATKYQFDLKTLQARSCLFKIKKNSSLVV